MSAGVPRDSSGSRGFEDMRDSFRTASPPTNGVMWAGNPSGDPSGEGAVPRFPHIKDLTARSKMEQVLTIHSSVDALLNRASQSTKQVLTDIDFGKPGRAYIEYLIALDIVINIVPGHRDYPSMSRARKDLHALLCKKNDSHYELIKAIHETITDDNRRTGIRPTLIKPDSPTEESSSFQSPQHLAASPRPLSMPGFQGAPHVSSIEKANLPHSDEMFFRDLTPIERPLSQPIKQRPEIRPKPGGLIPASTRNGSVDSPDLLAARFSQLRTPATPLPYPIDDNPPVIQPTRNGINSKFSLHPRRTDLGYYESRISEPRPLPPLPPPPPKIHPDLQHAIAFPRPPSPTYSPARNLASPPSVAPPRTSARSMLGPGGSISGQSVSGTGYSSRVNGNTYHMTEEDRRRLVDLPNAMAISAQELSDRFRTHNILLIDVRSREYFDEGHIMAAQIMCVEPLSLRHGLPAEELEESLVISPEAEQAMFSRRNEYDLIVYYDQNTWTNRFLEGPPNGTLAPHLRALHDTLYEFNYYKELQRPPAVLLGGLHAWVDLVGPNALQRSQTAAVMGSARPRRPLKLDRRGSRAPMASMNSSREIRMRRLREYNPLDADEDKAWREKARNEEVAAAELEQSQSDGDSDHEEQPSPLIHSYEEFLRKFPEPSAIQQSMTTSRYPPPERPKPFLPAVPSRPPPAVSRPSYSGVSERQLSSQAASQPNLPAPPLYTSRSITNNLKLPRTGLINFGVTCYMNATIQCLLATVPLSQFFLDNRWRGFIQKSWKGSNGIMPEIYANLIRSLWRNDVQAVRPTSFRKFCTRLNAEWGVDRQQDAKEFIEFLVDCLHEDLNEHWQRNPLRPLTTDEELHRERMPSNLVSKTEWDRYSHRESSFISSLFAGQHASRLRCTTCGNTSTTYEAFYSISIEIPRSGHGDIRHCLRSYCQEERLSGDEEWRCPYCKCAREATKRLTLTRLPQVLVVHFKRFSASKTEAARKLHTPIDFPLRGLAMEPYMADTRIDLARSGNAGGAGAGAGAGGASEEHADPAVTPPFQYDAYAVMRHLGSTSTGGHYIALVRDAARGCWRKFDDDRVTDFEPEKLKPDQRLQNEQAYIVFYGRSAAR